MKNVKIYLILLIAVISLPLYAAECPVSTDTRLLMKSHPNLTKEKLVKKDGQYSAQLKNGDIVLAKFSTCSLGMSAHYFSVKKMSDDETLARVKMFLSRVLPSEQVANKVLPQLAGLEVNKLKQAIVLKGLGSQHKIIIKPSASTIYKQHIQYDWIPPEF